MLSLRQCHILSVYHHSIVAPPAFLAFVAQAQPWPALTIDSRAMHARDSCRIDPSGIREGSMAKISAEKLSAFEAGQMGVVCSSHSFLFLLPPLLVPMSPPPTTVCRAGVMKHLAHVVTIACTAFLTRCLLSSHLVAHPCSRSTLIISLRLRTHALFVGHEKDAVPAEKRRGGAKKEDCRD